MLRHQADVHLERPGAPPHFTLSRVQGSVARAWLCCLLGALLVEELSFCCKFLHRFNRMWRKPRDQQPDMLGAGCGLLPLTYYAFFQCDDF